MVISLCVLHVLLLLIQSLRSDGTRSDLTVLTVATEHNDALERFLRSARLNDFDVKVLGYGHPWKGGDVATTFGGGQKVNLLKEELRKYKDSNGLVLFVDSYDVIFQLDKKKLLDAYKSIGAKVAFSAESFCWPREDLETSYPAVNKDEKRFLNSGGVIGPASVLYELVSQKPIKDDDDDQLYYTEIFLDSSLRKKYDIKLDKRSDIFLNLNGALNEIEFEEQNGQTYLKNTLTGKIPVILHGNGPIKHKFNSLTNYLSNSWTSSQGCLHCKENNIEVNTVDSHPVVVLSVVVDVPTPFMDIFFERIAKLAYPKIKMHVSIYILPAAASETKFVSAFNDTYGSQYASSDWKTAEEDSDIVRMHKHAYALCLTTDDCQFVFDVNPTVQITATNTLAHLVAANKSCLTPMMTRRGLLWSNFWGDLADDGYYARSHDFIDIVEGRQVGIWNVPFARDVFLLSRNAITKLVDMTEKVEEYEMTFASVLRDKNIFMMVDNRQPFGYLVQTQNRTTKHLHNDLWEFFDNPQDWEEQYIHPEYFKYGRENITMEEFIQPCPDVYWVPLMTPKFCRQIIEEMEFFGEWSNGKNTDPRLEGGYENVPTRDVHMRQVEWEAHWLGFLRKYIYPLQRVIFQGHNDIPWARMNFIVRYRPDEQPSLRPHHDASSYTVNIALNEPGKDYEGGGTLFNRYNCSLIKSRVGWGAIFPGRVTHWHEGLTTTAGTRYIFVTFINP